MKILVVEDQPKIAHSIQKGLQHEKYVVDMAFDGVSGLELAESDGYDLLILDWMLPGLDGVSLCKEIRSKGNHVPILILTAKNAIDDKVLGLDQGADDFMPKPFALAELFARVRALTRRPSKIVTSTLNISDITLNPTSFEVHRAGQHISLSTKEFALLEYFLRHPNTILSKNHIIDHVWPYDSEVMPNSVEVYVKHLRNKIDVPFKHSPQLIHTVRGFGYKLSEMK